MKNSKINKLTTIGILSALAIILALAFGIPIIPAAPFLKYDPKDVIIVIGAFIYGPHASIIMSSICAVLEVVFKGGNIIDIIMNIVASCAFCCGASFVYKLNKTKKGAVLGLGTGIVLMVITMAIWNYIFTPIYTGMPRATVAAMIPTVIIPFNLIKAVLNASLTLILYKRVVNFLRSKDLIESSYSSESKSSYLSLLGVIVFVTIVCIVLILKGII